MIVGASSPRRAWRRREWRRREWRRREWRRHDGSAGRGGRYCLTTARPALASRWWSRASATPGGSLSRRLSRAGRALPRSTGRPDRTVSCSACTYARALDRVRALACATSATPSEPATSHLGRQCRPAGDDRRGTRPCRHLRLRRRSTYRCRTPREHWLPPSAAADLRHPGGRAALRRLRDRTDRRTTPPHPMAAHGQIPGRRHTAPASHLRRPASSLPVPLEVARQEPEGVL